MEAVVILTWIGMLVASLVQSPTHQTTIILVDNNKARNAIVVKTKAGSVVIDKANEFVRLTSKETKPSKIKKMSQKEINTKFKDAIKALPPKPAHIYLYFKNGTSELTNESLNKLPLIYELIKKRAPCDVNVIGHTDTVGSQVANLKLSFKRAQEIKRWILSRNADLNNLSVESYGERDLLVPTADGISEPKNRTVEIFIK
jgi:outer membrane protein OmpA-like peptidoglycan-associated protein